MVTKESDFDQLRQAEDVDGIYDLFLGSVKQVASSHFERPLAPVFAEHKQELSQLLEAEKANAIELITKEQVVPLSLELVKNLRKYLQFLGLKNLSCTFVGFRSPICAWLLQVRIKRLKRDVNAAILEGRIDQVNDAWNDRHMAEAWRLSRLVAGSSQGPKRRYLQDPRCFPQAEDVLAHYPQRPQFGGFVAMNIPLEDAKEHRAENKIRRWDNELAARRARGDVRAVATNSRKMKCRKLVPDDAVPVEVRRMILSYREGSFFFVQIGTMRTHLRQLPGNGSKTLWQFLEDLMLTP